MALPAIITEAIENDRANMTSLEIAAFAGVETIDRVSYAASRCKHAVSVRAELTQIDHGCAATATRGQCDDAYDLAESASRDAFRRGGLEASGGYEKMDEILKSFAHTYPTNDLANQEIARLEERYTSLETQEQRENNRLYRMNLARLIQARDPRSPREQRAAQGAKSDD